MEQNGAEHIWTLFAKKLSGEATGAELHELNELLHNDPVAGYSREVLEDLWLCNPNHDRSYSESKYQELVQQIKQRGLDDGKFAGDDHYLDFTNPSFDSKKTRNRIVAISSLVIMLLIAGIFYASSNVDPVQNAGEPVAQNEINTKNGSKTSLVLPDGTKVWLNSNSQLTYLKSYGNKIREVSLTGEAYFDVVKNPEKPFIIHTNQMDVKVLGTAFNVKCYPGEKTIETSLVRGSIEVTLKDRKEKIMMKPNEKLVINNVDVSSVANKAVNLRPVSKAVIEQPIISLGHLTVYPADNTVIETAWVQNKLVFSSESFEEVALKMERWYNVRIQFADESIKQAPLTGNFEKETVEEALNALQFATKFSYTIKNNTIVITSKNNEFKRIK